MICFLLCLFAFAAGWAAKKYSERAWTWVREKLHISEI